MAVEDVVRDGHRRSGKAGRILCTRFGLSVEKEKHQPYAAQEGRTFLVRPNSKPRTGTAKNRFFRVQLTTSRIGSHITIIYRLLQVVLTIQHA